jgi:hypothetical protein
MPLRKTFELGMKPLSKSPDTFQSAYICFIYLTPERHDLHNNQDRVGYERHQNRCLWNQLFFEAQLILLQLYLIAYDSTGQAAKQVLVQSSRLRNFHPQNWCVLTSCPSNLDEGAVPMFSTLCCIVFESEYEHLKLDFYFVNDLW